MRERMELKGIGPKELGDRVGVTRQAIYQLLRGQEALKPGDRSRYIWSMAGKVKVVKVERLVELLRGDDQAADLVLRLARLLAQRRRERRKRRKM